MNKPHIYIKEIELINFESHKHTILKDFSPNFNCISGKGNVGKTSILRALALASYNKFSQEMVRIGTPFCEVKITTNIGSVYVKRGKGHNKWIITRNNAAKPLEFDKVGKSEVEEACSVLGIKMITLGNSEIPVNIMGQLEPHFFISSVGDEKTSGSSRAEIIDEICGLNGVEELVKTISLDIYRLTREITISEERIKELSGKLNSEVDIQKDIEILDKLNILQSNIETLTGNCDYIKDLKNSLNQELEIKNNLQSQISVIPDYQKAVRLIKHIREVTRKLQDARSLSFAIESSTSIVKTIRGSLSRLPDFSKAKELLEKIRILTSNYSKTKDIDSKLQELRKKKDIIESELLKLPKKNTSNLLVELRANIAKYNNCHQMLKSIENCKLIKEKINTDLTSLSKVDTKTLLSELKKCLNAYTEIASFKEGIETLVNRQKALAIQILTTKEEISKLKEDKEVLLKTIDVCPVTKKPISDVCTLSKA